MGGGNPRELTCELRLNISLQVFRLQGDIFFPDEIGVEVEFLNEAGDVVEEAFEGEQGEESAAATAAIVDDYAGDSTSGLGRCGEQRRRRVVPRPWSSPSLLSPRDLLVAPPGFVLLSADYSQVEMRLLAHYSNDQDLINAFKEEAPVAAAAGGGYEMMQSPLASSPLGATSGAGEDFFCRLARQWRLIPTGETVKDADRAAAKEMCYGIIYGAGETKLLAECYAAACTFDYTNISHSS